ncbi:MAG TPA: amidase family protein, partial [Steroidobacteraceae bacterium]|nr:amidase family protein [Steroidobacteraceae bacterium]
MPAAAPIVRATAMLACLAAVAQAAPPAHPPTHSPAMDRDLLEVTIPQLQRYYAEHRYTIAQVVDWHLDRIERYNGIYRALEQVFAQEARSVAAREDADKTSAHGALWGVPIVIKANTSIAGKVTSDGWEGFTIAGHELIAPRDATVVARLRAAGAVILGH